jgi:hypothetical protein
LDLWSKYWSTYEKGGYTYDVITYADKDNNNNNEKSPF